VDQRVNTVSIAHGGIIYSLYKRLCVSTHGEQRLATNTSQIMLLEDIRFILNIKQHTKIRGTR